MVISMNFLSFFFRAFYLFFSLFLFLSLSLSLSIYLSIYLFRCNFTYSVKKYSKVIVTLDLNRDSRHDFVHLFFLYSFNSL